MAIKRELRKREKPGAPRRDSKEPSNTMVDTRRSASANKWAPLLAPKLVLFREQAAPRSRRVICPRKLMWGAKPGSESRDIGLISSDRRGSDAEKAADACEAEQSRQPPGEIAIDGEKQNWQKTKAQGS